MKKKRNISTLAKKCIKLSHAFMNGHKEIADLYARPSSDRPCREAVTKRSPVSTLAAPVALADLLILRFLNYAHISEQRLANPSHLVKIPSLTS